MAAGMVLAGASGGTKEELCTAFKSRHINVHDISTGSHIRVDDLKNCYNYDIDYHTAVKEVSKNKCVTYNQIDNRMLFKNRLCVIIS